MLVDLGETGAKHSHGTLEAAQQSRGKLGAERFVLAQRKEPSRAGGGIGADVQDMPTPAACPAGASSCSAS